MTPDSPVVAIHQPNYIPWLGYFHKMWESDIFVLLDTVQFPRGQSFANRNRVKTHNGTSWLTIPVSTPSGEKGKVPYTEVEFAGTKWKRKHLRTLQMNYKKADYYDEIYPMLEKEIEKHLDFVELNIALITKIASYLGIQTRPVRLSSLLDTFGEKTDLIIDICKKLHSSIYLSGTGGGKEYNDEEKLNENDIELRYSRFAHPEYPQLWDGFEPNLSVIDLLFNCGPESSAVLFRKQ
ncbi:WbqC family protein [Halalkalibaculum sp. DA3122]|uniref:WbqC family protein n=1 Tax=Halalkalibaculum sp. DA3122 TaxID=3373607 RepID=UPI00375447CF